MAFQFSDRRKYMALLTGYYDETGDSKDPVQRWVGMAGFAAPAEKWEILERKWKLILKEFHVPYFHMKEFAHSEGIFREWKNKETKRRRIFGSLIATIKEVLPLPIGFVFSAEDFRALPERDRNLIVDPYYLSFVSCVATPLHLIQDAPPDVKLATVFGEHGVFGSKAKEYYRQMKRIYEAGDRLYPPDFRDMREFVPLQAADIIAYELYKEADRQRFRPNDESRFGMSQITKMRDSVTNANTIVIASREHLHRLIADMKRIRSSVLTGARLPEPSIRLRQRKV